MEEATSNGVEEVEPVARRMVSIPAPSWKDLTLLGMMLLVLMFTLWASGYASAQSDDTHSQFTATVASIDPGADTSHYQNLQVGSRITVTLDWTALATFQENGPGMTLCTGDGLAINSYSSPDEQTLGLCHGPRIHVVLFPSSQLLVPPPQT